MIWTGFCSSSVRWRSRLRSSIDLPTSSMRTRPKEPHRKSCCFMRRRIYSLSTYITVFSRLRPKPKAPKPKRLSECGTVTSRSRGVLANALAPMRSTPFSSSTLCKRAQSRKARLPIFETCDGTVSSVIAEHPRNAPDGISCNAPAKRTSRNEKQPRKISGANAPSASSISTRASSEQSAKAALPIVETHDGKESSVRETHPRNASVPILRSSRPKVISRSIRQFAKVRSPTTEIISEGSTACKRVQFANAPFASPVLVSRDRFTRAKRLQPRNASVLIAEADAGMVTSSNRHCLRKACFPTATNSALVKSALSSRDFHLNNCQFLIFIFSIGRSFPCLQKNFAFYME